MGRFWWASALALAVGTSAAAAESDPLAARFGAREVVSAISLSPDGSKVAIITAGPGKTDRLVTLDTATHDVKLIGGADAKPLRLRYCGWSSNTRIVCKLAGSQDIGTVRASYTRLLGMDSDGTKPLYLGRRVSGDALRANQFDGSVIDWREGDGSVLMTRDFVPEETTGSNLRSTRDGLGVELVDTNTGKSRVIEQPGQQISDYFADGQGNIRIRATDPVDGTGMLTGTTVYSYRTPDSRSWKSFSKWTIRDGGMQPLAVDGTANAAYVAQKLDGRDALYRVALDGSMKTELVFANKDVDVDGVVTLGRRGRVIGAAYVTDRRQVEYFDPYYKKLAASLARALPKTPLIRFLSASADEQKLLVFAGSDVDAGTYYVYNKADRHLDRLIGARGDADDLPPAEMKAITFKAADGTAVPAYLTLPPGGARTGLPAIVMPHGGPSYRDEWGFDWLVQYFAHAGYAVLQPNYRGSTGYGDAWFANNAFKSWQSAIGDVNDAGRWLVKEGIADPARLAIVGWSYGGYAALQANVVDPGLFKAVVAIAPVTDLGMTKREARGFTNAQLVADQIGSGPLIAAGSPARHAEKFLAPVLMFSGDQDLNVDVSQARAMDAALRKAGKKSTLVVFPTLDHQIDDTDARVRMLGEANAFMRRAFGK